MNATKSCLAAVVCLGIAWSSADAGFSLKAVETGWSPASQGHTWIAQLDSDPALEIISLRGDFVEIHDGMTGAVEFSASQAVASDLLGASCDVIDVDGDGFLEIELAPI